MPPFPDRNALVIVDFQYDFYAGSLAVPNAQDALDPLIEAGRAADIVVFTRDFHPADHMSFKENPEFVDKSWPPHCVQGTDGVMLHPTLEREFPNAVVFSKGTNRDTEEYSGFAGRSPHGMDLETYLASKGVGEVYIGGLALDYCVNATAIDACKEFDVTVLADCTRPVHPVSGTIATARMADIHGINFETISDTLVA